MRAPYRFRMSLPLHYLSLYTMPCNFVCSVGIYTVISSAEHICFGCLPTLQTVEEAVLLPLLSLKFYFTKNQMLFKYFGRNFGKPSSVWLPSVLPSFLLRQYKPIQVWGLAQKPDWSSCTIRVPTCGLRNIYISVVLHTTQLVLCSQEVHFVPLSKRNIPLQKRGG